MRRKSTSFSVSVVIPILNNEATAEKQLRECLKELQSIKIPFEVLLSNDASTDRTEEIANRFSKRKNMRVYHQKTRLGIANNLKFLYRQAMFAYTLLYSIDGDWSPKDIKRLIVTAQKTQANIVIGERVVKDYPFSRKVVSSLYNFLPQLLFRVKTYDAGSIKVFNSQLFREEVFHSDTVNFEAEMIIRASKNGAKILSIPVTFKKHSSNKKSSVNYRLIISSFLDMILLRFRLH